MGLFGSLFEKKECSICGGEIGLLGNRKLEDGNLCKDCARKLSPWFSERRHSTVEEIRQQLAYREENQAKAAQFSTSRSLGDDWKLLTDDAHRWLTVTRARNLSEANPDILDYGAVTGCRMDIDESRSELTRTDKDGKEVSYNSPRYEYSYDFDIIVSVNHPYFDEMPFRLNSSDVTVAPNSPVGGLGRFSTASDGFDPMRSPEYRQYYDLAQEICEEIRRIQDLARGTAPEQGVPAAQQYAPQAVPAAGPWTCPSCGGSNSGKFCEYCGSPRPQ